MDNRSINRSVLLLRAKEPFRDWIMSLPEPMDVTLDEINDDTSVFLIQEYEDDGEKEKLVKKIYLGIFEEQLEDWSRDKNHWPKNRSLATFKKCFDVEFHSLVFDLVGTQIIAESD